MNEKFPMQNQMTEYACKVVRDTEEEIERNAKEMKIERGDYVGCNVENMRPHILSDLCLIHNEGTIPSIMECQHSGKMRYYCKTRKTCDTYIIIMIF